MDDYDIVLNWAGTKYYVLRKCGRKIKALRKYISGGVAELGTNTTWEAGWNYQVLLVQFDLIS